MLPAWCCVSRATARCPDRELPPLSSSKASISSCCIPSIAMDSAYSVDRPRCSARSSACAMRRGFHSWRQVRAAGGGPTKATRCSLEASALIHGTFGRPRGKGGRRAAICSSAAACATSLQWAQVQAVRLNPTAPTWSRIRCCRSSGKVGRVGTAAAAIPLRALTPGAVLATLSCDEVNSGKASSPEARELIFET